MTFSEKSLYHQIHPLKLLTDIISSFISLYYFWQHDLLLGLLFAFAPTILISAIVIQSVDLEKYKESKMGKYVKQYMSPKVQSVRLLGFLIMSFAAWQQSFLGLGVGLLFILPAWGYGWFLSMFKTHT